MLNNMQVIIFVRKISFYDDGLPDANKSPQTLCHATVLAKYAHLAALFCSPSMAA